MLLTLEVGQAAPASRDAFAEREHEQPGGEPGDRGAEHPCQASGAAPGKRVVVEHDGAQPRDRVGHEQRGTDGVRPPRHLGRRQHGAAEEEHPQQDQVVEHLDALPDQGDTRDVVRRHPNAAALITSQHVMPVPALRVIQTHIAVAAEGGIPEAQAYALLRTITWFALGSALVEVSWGFAGPGCAPVVSDLLRPGVPDELVEVADVYCGQSNPDAEFELGLDLMLRSTEHSQSNSPAETS